MTDKLNTNAHLLQTTVIKSVFGYEIEKLDSGFLINKMDLHLNAEGFEKCGSNITKRVGISNADSLETEMNKVISNHISLKDNLYFNNKSKVRIKLSIEVIP